MLRTVSDLQASIWDVLGDIEDPELPISVVDLGIIDSVDVTDGDVRITMIPTYSACPAIDVMRQSIASAVAEIPGVTGVRVTLSFARPWTMDRMTEQGKQRLVTHGMALLGSRGAGQPGGHGLDPHVTCPFCGSTNTTLENPFGPTLCRAIYYCNDCKNPIERFKPPLDS